MSHTIFIVATLVCSLTLGAQRPDPGAEIRVLEQREALAVTQRDSATLRALWHKDYVVNAPDGRIVLATADPLDRPVMQRPRTTFTREVENVVVNGDVAFSMGRETLVPAGDASNAGQTVHRRFTNIWIRQAGEWKLSGRHANVICP